MMLINKAKVRAFAMAVAKERHHKFTRVSRGFYALCDANLKAFVRGHIMRLPSKGKTIE